MTSSDFSLFHRRDRYTRVYNSRIMDAIFKKKKKNSNTETMRISSHLAPLAFNLLLLC
jgi:hypothetical protein